MSKNALYTFLTENVIEICQGSDYFDSVTIEAPFVLAGCTAVSVLRNAEGGLVGSFECTINAETNTVGRKLSKELSIYLTPTKEGEEPNYVWGLRLSALSANVTYPEISGGATVRRGVVL